jgi:hypothetical protein
MKPTEKEKASTLYALFRVDYCMRIVGRVPNAMGRDEDWRMLLTEKFAELLPRVFGMHKQRIAPA